MDTMGIAAIAIAFGGLLIMAGAVRNRRPATDVAGYFHDLDTAGDEESADQYAEVLRQPFVMRAIRPLAGGVLAGLSSLTPKTHVDRMHRQLLLAGMNTTMRAEEMVVIQAIATAFGLMAGVGFVTVLNPSPAKGLAGLILLTVLAGLAPMVWLSRKADERQESIFKDLPDALDLLAISVEAGVGFEAAMQVVCTHFTSPLAEEFSRTLKEMELGLSRKEALHNLKRRTEVPELSNFVLALIQADALGMPIGRVLHTQANELRNKRRQWAREKAAKLPVKILFPLVLFIFPAVLVVILGPAGATIFTGLK